MALYTIVWEQRIDLYAPSRVITSKHLDGGNDEQWSGTVKQNQSLWLIRKMVIA